MNTPQPREDVPRRAADPLNIAVDVEVATGDSSAIPGQICKCGLAALIPGLDGYLCSGCGWVEGRSLAELAALKGRSGKR